MPIFQSKRFRPSGSTGSTLGDRIGQLYRARLSKHPFLLFGLPFLSLMVAGSFVLTPATAIRYERHDRRVQQVSQQEALSLGIKSTDDNPENLRLNPRRRILGDEKEEYYRLMAKDLDDWEQKRVKRWKGEPDGRIG
ncbi:Cytochrome oxidase assembly [Ophidiomyces ophidiicola]|nr:Cytochrome oxidase assembly [Ophidiomyces ophidiicola]